MKSFFVLAAAAVVAAVSADDCNLATLAPLLQDSDVKTCGSQTGLSPPIPPAQDVLPKLCDNTFCQAALAKLKALKVGDCTVAGIRIETDFINPIEAYCASKSPAPAPAPTSGTPTTGTPTTGTPTTGTPTTGTPTTQKPVC